MSVITSTQSQLKRDYERVNIECLFCKDTRKSRAFRSKREILYHLTQNHNDDVPAIMVKKYRNKIKNYFDLIELGVLHN